MPFNLCFHSVTSWFCVFVVIIILPVLPLSFQVTNLHKGVSNQNSELYNIELSIQTFN